MASSPDRTAQAQEKEYTHFIMSASKCMEFGQLEDIKKSDQHPSSVSSKKWCHKQLLIVAAICFVFLLSPDDPCAHPFSPQEIVIKLIAKETKTLDIRTNLDGTATLLYLITILIASTFVCFDFVNEATCWRFQKYFSCCSNVIKMILKRVKVNCHAQSKIGCSCNNKKKGHKMPLLNWKNRYVGFLLLVNPALVSGTFTPADRVALKTAVDACILETDDGSCPTFFASNDATGNPYGSMAEWDISRVTSLSQVFSFDYNSRKFNADLSKWDTSKVTTLLLAFASANAFNADLSKVSFFFSFFLYLITFFY